MPIFEKLLYSIIDTKHIPQKPKDSLISFCVATFLIFSLPSHADNGKELPQSLPALKLSAYLESYYVLPRHNGGDLPKYVYS